eukprot:m.78747 g.78747  ORF g.78747 m.78747 type:complete len:136 (-) comp14596_c0_seq2:27-434(-)
MSPPRADLGLAQGLPGADIAMSGADPNVTSTVPSLTCTLQSMVSRSKSPNSWADGSLTGRMSDPMANSACVPHVAGIEKGVMMEANDATDTLGRSFVFHRRVSTSGIWSNCLTGSWKDKHKHSDRVLVNGNLQLF